MVCNLNTMKLVHENLIMTSKKATFEDLTNMITSFVIVQFPFLCSNMPAYPAYNVFVS